MRRTGYPTALYRSGVHPAQLIAEVDPDLFPEAARAVQALTSAKASDLGGMVEVALDLPYPADPALEPDLVGLTYAQVAVLKQVKAAALGDGFAFDRVFDRTVGKPVAKKVSVKANIKYTDFLDGIKQEIDADITDADTRPASDS